MNIEKLYYLFLDIKMKKEVSLLKMNKGQQLLNIIKHIEDPIAQKTDDLV